MSGAFLPDQPGAEVRASSNFGVRRDCAAPDMIVLHYTGMESGEGAEAWLCDPASEVSSHYLVYENGRIVQMVREADRAWHAGKSSWHGDTDINSCSVGIEIVNPGHALGYKAFPRRQIDAVIALCRGIIARHHIRPERVLGHSDVAPGRKIDPGEKFPWRTLAEAGIGLYARPVRISGGPDLRAGNSGKAVEQFQIQLSRFGYGIEASGVFDERTQVVTAAFQRHFRPRRVDGIADHSTLKTLDTLLDILACDAG